MGTVAVMPAGRPPRHSREDFVAAGIHFADRNGIPALTLRQLGLQLGVSTTAVYRYFPDKGALLSTMRDALLQKVAARFRAADDPASNLVGMAMAMRDVVREHPCFGQVLLESPLSGPAIDSLPLVVFGFLADLGLEPAAVARAYRQLESTVLGASMFDFAGAPDHLTQRLGRMQRLGHPAYAGDSIDAATIDAENETAFHRTVETLVAALVIEGAKKTTSHAG